MIHTDGIQTIANAPARGGFTPPDRVLIDQDELDRRLAEAQAKGFHEGWLARAELEATVESLRLIEIIAPLS